MRFRPVTGMRVARADLVVATATQPISLSLAVLSDPRSDLAQGPLRSDVRKANLPLLIFPLFGCCCASHEGSEPDASQTWDAATPDAAAPDGGNPPDSQVEVVGPDAAPVGACRPARPAHGRVELDFEVDGRRREAAVVLPSGYDGETPIPSIYALHGWARSGERVANLSGFNAWGEEHTVALVYLEGTGLPSSWNAGSCCGSARWFSVDDLRYVAEAIELAERQLCLDPSRRAAIGVSNGGAMIYRLLCEASELFTAVSSIAGFDATVACDSDRPLSFFHVHGTGDWIIPAEGRDLFGQEAVLDTVNRWATRFGCRRTSPISGPGECTRYSECRDDSVINLCFTEDGHSWPGGNETTEAVGAFFRASWE